MSESSSLSGAKQTYIDGDIANNGAKTLTGITVQVGFHDFTGLLAQKETMPLQSDPHACAVYRYGAGVSGADCAGSDAGVSADPGLCDAGLEPGVSGCAGDWG